MMMNDYDGQMISRDLVGLKLPDIRLTGEENPEKKTPRKLVPTGDRTRARCGTSVENWLKAQAAGLYGDGIGKLVPRYEKCLRRSVDYNIEK